MALVTPTDVRAPIELALRGKRRDVRGLVFRLGLLDAPARAGDPPRPDRHHARRRLARSSRMGVDFVRSDTSSLASRTGVWQGLIGSLILAGFVVVFAIPIGVAAAVFLEEYARDTRLNRFLIANIRNLAGGPLGRLRHPRTRRVREGPPRRHGSRHLREELHVGGELTLAVLVMPIVILITMEALQGRPFRHPRRRLRGGRNTVGGRPEPRPAVRGAGDLHRAILALARAFGETAPLLLGAVTGYLNTPSGRDPIDVVEGPTRP